MGQINLTKTAQLFYTQIRHSVQEAETAANKLYKEDRLFPD